MLLISVQEVSRQLAWEALNAGYRGVVTKGAGDEVVRGVRLCFATICSFTLTMDHLPVRLRPKAAR